MVPAAARRRSGCTGVPVPDGIHSGLRGDDGRLCVLVVIGVNARGDKHFLAIEDGVRGSPGRACGGGTVLLGFWSALSRGSIRETRSQRCWMHKTGNVLNYFPKCGQRKAKQGLHEIWMAETRPATECAFDHWIERYEDKYPKATACLARDREGSARLLRLPRGALDALAHDERDRVVVRHHPSPELAGEGLRHPAARCSR